MNDNKQTSVADMLLTILKVVGALVVALFGLLLLFGGTANNKTNSQTSQPRFQPRRRNDCGYCENCGCDTGDCDCY